MSFSFSVQGKRPEAIEQVKERGGNTNAPESFLNTLAETLGEVPENADVAGSVNGHTGWTENQTAGQLSLNATFSVTVPSA